MVGLNDVGATVVDEFNRTGERELGTAVVTRESVGATFVGGNVGTRRTR